MKRILLACASGMSTSLLVSKMKEAAEAKNVEAKSWADDKEKAESEFEKADDLLIGPQMRFMKKKLSKNAEEAGVPLDVIDPVAYGRIDGEAVLNKALELIGE